MQNPKLDRSKMQVTKQVWNWIVMQLPINDVNFSICLGGGDKRILEVKTDFKERAKPKVGSKDNMTYQPGKLEIML